jgi:SAM-dependent methyltransferase
MTNIGDLSPSLRKHENGIWSADQPGSEISYPEFGNEICFQVEDRSFWFAHRNDCIHAMIQRLGISGPLLDVGGGNGFVCKSLESQGIETILLEPGATGAWNGTRRGLSRVVRATLEQAQFREGTIASAGAFDVIEHTRDDSTFLNSVFRVLRPGGWFIATVPAYPWLWSTEDVYAGHFRRYTLGRLADALRRAGFREERGTYIFLPLVIPILLLRALPFRLGRPMKPPGTDVAEDHQAGGRLLRASLRPEIAAVRSGIRIPLGASCLMAARKPL